MLLMHRVTSFARVAARAARAPPSAPPAAGVPARHAWTGRRRGGGTSRPRAAEEAAEESTEAAGSRGDEEPADPKLEAKLGLFFSDENVIRALETFQRQIESGRPNHLRARQAIEYLHGKLALLGIDPAVVFGGGDAGAAGPAEEAGEERTPPDAAGGGAVGERARGRRVRRVVGSNPFQMSELEGEVRSALAASEPSAAASAAPPADPWEQLSRASVAAAARPERGATMVYALRRATHQMRLARRKLYLELQESGEFPYNVFSGRSPFLYRLAEYLTVTGAKTGAPK